MNFNRILVLFVIPVAVALFGCSANPTTQWAQQRESLSNAEKTLAPAAASGKLTRTEVDIADAGFQAWRAALADAEAHLPAGGSVFEQDIQIAKSVGKRLADTYLAPATQPSR
jgi:hypothetical protein